MELCLGNNNKDELTGGNGGNVIGAIKKEHMFDKVVTPSDVGKLNRLVIPKQYAEKYFPLVSSPSSSSSNDNKGLILNFEDSNGKPWRFRYSYWNSSQSYVMTKGWSRFVKDKKLDAGDIVSFHRGVGDQARHLLFIDCRKRPTPTLTPHVNHLQNLCHCDFAPAGFRNEFTFRWGNFPPPPPPFRYSNNVQANCDNYAFYGMRPSTGGVGNHYGVGGGGGDDVAVPMVIDSVPVVEGRSVGKRLRLFGVNMDYCPVVPSSGNSSCSCGEEIEEEEAHLVVGRPTTNGLISARDRLDATSSMLNVGDTTTLQLRLPSSSTSSGSWGGGLLPMQSHALSKKGKTNSLSFDLDL